MNRSVGSGIQFDEGHSSFGRRLAAEPACRVERAEYERTFAGDRRPKG